MSKPTNDEDLTPEQFNICRLKGTEAPFTGEYWNLKETGIYKCVCCGANLFSSNDKYDSGTGWPSYTQPTSTHAVTEVPDSSHGISRTEVTCKACHAHLGHVFNDGPKPSGLRYCINSAALRFVKTDNQ